MSITKSLKIFLQFTLLPGLKTDAVASLHSSASRETYGATLKENSQLHQDGNNKIISRQEDLNPYDQDADSAPNPGASTGAKSSLGAVHAPFPVHSQADYTQMMTTARPQSDGRLRLPGQQLRCHCTDCKDNECVTDGYCYTTITVDTTTGVHESYE